MTDVDADELISPVPGARAFELEPRALLGDCAPNGRMRLDAIANWLQDVAYCDVLDAGVAELGFWVLRRTRIVVERFPQFAEPCRVRTFCSGTGRMWAERRTSIWGAGAGAAVPIVEAVALWIHLDPQTRMPSPLADAELACFGAGAERREVGRRLRHPRPGGARRAGDWWLREADSDVAEHINNAAYWQPLEEELIGRERQDGVSVAAIDAEVEFRAPAQPGRKLLLADGEVRWLVEPGDDDVGTGEVYASTIVRNIRTTAGSN